MKVKNLILIVLMLLFASCSSVETNKKPIKNKKKDENIVFDVDDPWEPFNRRMYYFNAKLDKYVLLPATNGYKAVTPDPVERGVHNFFNNLGEVKNFGNSVLQGDMQSSVISFNRFVVNTTFGVLGLFDVATKLGLERQKEDFGLTLAHYGVKSGPYLVLPVFGPSSLRDASGIGVDSIGRSYADPLEAIGTSQSDPYIMGANVIDTRSNTKFRYYETGSPFEYEYVRYLYLKLRDIEAGNIEK